jgi:hypothetical protein
MSVLCSSVLCNNPFPFNLLIVPHCCDCSPPTPVPHQVLDCAALVSTSIVIATRRSHAVSSGSADAGSGKHIGDCSVWLLDCAPLCAAIASGAASASHALVHRSRAWSSPYEKSKVHATPDEEPTSSDVRLLALSALNLLAVCCSSGIVYLLTTHGVHFTVRSSFSRHSKLVHALAYCEHEGLIISGGVSRCDTAPRKNLVAHCAAQGLVLVGPLLPKHLRQDARFENWIAFSCSDGSSFGAACRQLGSDSVT